jgi:hypothetical protein
MDVKKSIFLLPGLFLLMFGSAFGQAREDSWDNLKRLRQGQKVQIVSMQLSSIEGEFLGFSDETILLQQGKDEIVLKRSHVLRVTTKSGRLQKVLINASIGALAGLALGAVSDYYDDIDSSDSGANSGKLGAMAVGAGIGTGIGAAFPGNDTIYRAKPPGKD